MVGFGGGGLVGSKKSVTFPVSGVDVSIQCAQCAYWPGSATCKGLMSCLMIYERYRVLLKLAVVIGKDCSRLS